MSADKKPVWLDEQAHAILKDFAKLVKKSATDVTSDLVIQHLHMLDAVPFDGTAPAAPAPAPVEVIEREEIDEAPAEPARYVEVSAKDLEAPRSTPTPSIPKRERKQREDDGRVRYLGGVKFY